MKAIIKSICAILILLPIIATAKGALQEQTFILRNNDTVIAHISKKEITRIVFESDITFISSIAGELEYTTKGQDLYLRPNVEKPINFFVKTEDDQTYRFLVDAKDSPSTQIFIKTNNKRNLEGSLVLHRNHNIKNCQCSRLGNQNQGTK
jgi:hypothetical protein